MKAIKIFLIFILMFIVLSNNIYAWPSVGEIIETGVDVIDKGIFGAYLADDTAMDIDVEIGETDNIRETEGFIESILGYLQVIGSIISIVALIIIGCRYMFSSLEEKANMKGILIYYIVGAVLVFATSNLLGVIYRIIKSISF